MSDFSTLVLKNCEQEKDQSIHLILGVIHIRISPFTTDTYQLLFTTLNVQIRSKISPFSVIENRLKTVKGLEETVRLPFEHTTVINRVRTTSWSLIFLFIMETLRV